MTEWILLGISLLLVLACGVFVAAEFALVTVDRNAVEKAASGGDTGAQGVQRALKSLSTQLSGAQVGITVTNLAIGFLAEPAIAELVDGPLLAAGLPEGAVTPVAIGIALTLSTALTMIFGELVPKNLAIAEPLGTARATQGFMRGVHRGEQADHRRAQRLRQRARTPPRHRAAGGAAVRPQLRRARLADPAVGRPGHPGPRHRRAHGAVRGVRQPDRRRDHDPAGAHHQHHRHRPGQRGHRPGPQHRPLALPGPRRPGERRRHRARQARRRAAGARAGHHPHQAHHGQADRGAGLPAPRPAAGAAARRRASRWPSSSTSTAARPAS